MKKILIVDDEKDFTNRLEKILAASGYEVTTAFEGREGLEKAQKERPHLVLLDIMMSGMDGLEVLSKLRNNEETSLLNIIMVTAKGDTDSIMKAENSQATDYIIKPFELNELLEMIKKYI